MRTGLGNQLTYAEHTVYRCYDQQDRLIYVGCTARYKQRINSHYKTMWWAQQIVRIETETYPSRMTALHAETKIRDTEHPRWNIEARWMRRHLWTNQMFDDYVTAMERHPSNKTPKWAARIEAARQLQFERFGTNRQQAA